jgi:hypothetical protein
LTFNQGVMGSIPIGLTKDRKGLCQDDAARDRGAAGAAAGHGGVGQDADDAPGQGLGHAGLPVGPLVGNAERQRQGRAAFARQQRPAMPVAPVSRIVNTLGDLP